MFTQNRRGPLVWALVYVSVLIWSAIDPHDVFTWLLEVLPAIVAAFVLLATRQRFPLTPLTYVLLLVHCIILMIGGHYTYAEVPAFNWLQDSLDLSRNHYDKIGHFAQGFVPAMIAREILIRKRVFAKPVWLPFLVVCFCLAVSAFYELIEWWVALATGDSAEAFLGTQGDPWDTQSDMALALLGAIAALTLLSRWQDRELGSIPGKS